jgi:hypothetical protein
VFISIAKQTEEDKRIDKMEQIEMVYKTGKHEGMKQLKSV